MLGYSLAIFTGLTLGLLGGGGSVLTVPILVYIFHLEAKTSIALSLAIVGISALAGVIENYKHKKIEFKIAFIFMGAALPGTLTGSYLSQYISGDIQLTFFALIMLLASVFMIKGRSQKTTQADQSSKTFFIIFSSFGVGVITGLIGVGGGFLIVPALIYFSSLDIKKAVGTSLFIISINSLVGFIAYINIVTIPWNILLSFSACTIIGIIIGAKLAHRVPQQILKKGFGVFLILVSLFIIYQNFLLK